MGVTVQSSRCAILLVLILCGTASLRADEAEIRQFVRDYEEAFNGQDLESASAMWSEDCVHIDGGTGEQTKGRAGIRDDLAEVFESPEKTVLTCHVDDVRLIKVDVASVRGTAVASIPGEEPDISRFNATLVKQGGQWQIDSIEELSTPPLAPAYDILRELEWLLGTWVDDSEEERITSVFQWSANGAFLIRSFSSGQGEQEAQLGTQIIGWDPRSKQIRSWTFNADGSFGDGIWSTSDNRWLIKSSQTLPDGAAASGTYIVTPVDENTLTLQLVAHEIAGEPQPTCKPVTVVRVSD